MNSQENNILLVTLGFSEAFSMLGILTVADDLSAIGAVEPVLKVA